MACQHHAHHARHDCKKHAGATSKAVAACSARRSAKTGGGGNSRASAEAAALCRLREAGHRVTAQRRAMLRVLAGTGPISIDALHRALASGTADPATVYRSILAFEEAGIVQRHPLENGGNLYCLGGCPATPHHHHVICRVCGRMEEVDGCAAAPFERIARDLGYTRISHVFEIYGVCPACAPAAAAPAISHPALDAPSTTAVPLTSHPRA